jgi:hypothetical protein
MGWFNAAGLKILDEGFKQEDGWWLPPLPPSESQATASTPEPAADATQEACAARNQQQRRAPIWIISVQSPK